MANLKQHLKRLEAKRRELEEIRAGARQKLLVLWGYEPSVLDSGDLPALPLGQRHVEDLYLRRDPDWKPNYCFLTADSHLRITADPEDHGVVYDARAIDRVDHENPQQGLPVIAKLLQDGKIDFDSIKRWPGAIVSNRRVPLGANVAKRCHARSR